MSFLFLHEGIKGGDKWQASLLKGEQIRKSVGTLEYRAILGGNKDLPWETLANRPSKALSLVHTCYTRNSVH